jgi:hypothetical protein
MRRVMGVLMLAAAFCLVACGEAKLDHGTIVKKVHEPERTTVIFVPMRISCGNNCSSTIQIPYYIHDGEDFKLQLRTDAQKGVAYVDAETFFDAKVGQEFDARKKGVALEDPNNDREKKG